MAASEKAGGQVPTKPVATATHTHIKAAAPAAPPPDAGPTTTSLLDEIKSMRIPERAAPAPAPVTRNPAAGRGADDLMVEELEEFDLDDDTGGASVGGGGGGGSEYRTRGGGDREEVIARAITMAEAGEMKTLLFGSGKVTFNSAWKQGVCVCVCVCGVAVAVAVGVCMCM